MNLVSEIRQGRGHICTLVMWITGDDTCTGTLAVNVRQISYRGLDKRDEINKTTNSLYNGFT